MTSTSKHVIDVTEQTFQADVVDASKVMPVIVDFWAEWCGPCRQLGPALEQLAEEAGGAFRLAKVDVDSNPGLAQAFRATSIPMVIAIFNGALVDQFTGALPKPELKRFVAALLEHAGVAPPQDAAAEAPADPAQALGYWEDQVAKHPGDGAPILALGQTLVALGRLDDAGEVLGKIEPAMPEYNAAQAAIALRSLSEEVLEGGGESAARDRLTENPADPEAQYLVALSDGARGQFAASLQVLVALVSSAEPELRDKAKASAKTVLSAAGRGDDQVEGLRRKLGRLLF